MVLLSALYIYMALVRHLGSTVSSSYLARTRLRSYQVWFQVGEKTYLVQRRYTLYLMLWYC